MKGWQSMKRIITAILATGLLTGALVALSPTAASARAPSDCAWSARYAPYVGNGMAWSTSDNEAFHTPMMYAGACGKVYVESLGVHNAPPCTRFMLKTYNSDGSLNYRGAWYTTTRVGQTVNIRGSGRISNGRAYRIYAHGCDGFRDPAYAPGFNVYTHGV